MSEIAPLKHNNPPTDAEVLQEYLFGKNAAILKRADDLVEAAKRVPENCPDDETAGKISELIKQINGAAKALETTRVAEKEPFLSQGRIVDGFFKSTTDRLAAAVRQAKTPLDGFLRRKEVEERRRREDEAAALRKQEQDNLAAAALLEQAKLKPEAQNILDDAVAAGDSAIKAQQAAEARPAELSRTRSDMGALASLRTVWVGEMVDQRTLDLDKLRHHISPADLQKAINSYVRAGGRELAGAKIFEKSETVVR